MYTEKIIKQYIWIFIAKPLLFIILKTGSETNFVLLTAKLGYAWPFCFTQKQVFLALVLPNLNRFGFFIAHTYCCTEYTSNTLVGPLRPRAARGRLQAKPERLCSFCNTCNAPIIYRDDGFPRFPRQTVTVEVRSGAIMKIPEFYSARDLWRFTNVLWLIDWLIEIKKNSIFSRFYGTLRLSCAQPTWSSFTQINGTDGKPRLWRYAFC